MDIGPALAQRVRTVGTGVGHVFIDMKKKVLTGHEDWTEAPQEFLQYEKSFY